MSEELISDMFARLVSISIVNAYPWFCSLGTPGSRFLLFFGQNVT